MLGRSSSYGTGGAGDREPLWRSRIGRSGGGLRGAFRDGLEAGRRAVLGYVEKRFSSWTYRGALGGSGKGARNLTERLTPCLTARLTGYLPRDLTESGDSEGRAWSKWGSGSQGEGCSALGLGLVQHPRDHAVVDAESLGHDVLP